MRTLLAAGTTISIGETNGSALTAAAASGGREGVASLLLEHGASVTGVGALCAAASSGSAAMVQRLLDAGADPNERVEIPAPHDISIGPLVNAVINAAPSVVALLVDAGADVNARDRRGDTALILLAEVTTRPSEQVRIARILVAAGADVNARGEHDRTAFLHGEPEPKLAPRRRTAQRGRRSDDRAQLVTVFRDAAAVAVNVNLNVNLNLDDPRRRSSPTFWPQRSRPRDSP